MWNATAQKMAQHVTHLEASQYFRLIVEWHVASVDYTFVQGSTQNPESG